MISAYARHSAKRLNAVMLNLYHSGINYMKNQAGGAIMPGIDGTMLLDSAYLHRTGLLSGSATGRLLNKTIFSKK